MAEDVFVEEVVVVEEVVAVVITIILVVAADGLAVRRHQAMEVVEAAGHPLGQRWRGVP